jgi:hypothetical protein
MAGGSCSLLLRAKRGGELRGGTDDRVSSISTLWAVPSGDSETLACIANRRFAQRQRDAGGGLLLSAETEHLAT